MIPSAAAGTAWLLKVYQRGLVIDSQLVSVAELAAASVSKGIGD